MQATLPGTWSQEPLYSLSEFWYIVYSLAYERRLFTHSHTSTFPPPRRIQPTHLYKRTSSLAQTIQHSPQAEWKYMYGLSQPSCWETLRLGVLRSTIVAMMGFEPTNTPHLVVSATHWTTRATGYYYYYYYSHLRRLTPTASYLWSQRNWGSCTRKRTPRADTPCQVHVLQN